MSIYDNLNRDAAAAYDAGVAAERERIRQLAVRHQATYWVGPDNSPAPRRPFALLIQFGELDPA